MRGQLLARQLMILLSWSLLIAVIIVAFVLQSFDNQNLAALEASLAPSREAVLNAYLRQSIEYGGEQIPFAEYIQVAIVMNDKTLIRQKTEAFLALLPTSYKHRIGIYLPGDNEWLNIQESALHDAAQARTKLLLPDGRLVEIDYAREQNE